MGLYMEGYNTFLLYSTPNQFSVNYLNPFHPMVTMAVTIQYPLLPNFDSDEFSETPTFELSDFLGYCSVFNEFLDNENALLYPTFTLYRALAINNIRYANVKDELNWRFLIAHYIGHYLTMHLEDLKDINNKYSLNQETVERSYKVEDLKLLGENEFLKTAYGIRFWDKYKIIGKWVFKGYRTQRGR